MKIGSLNFLERKPTIQTDIPAPLLVLLHGYGSNEADLFSFAAELPKNLHIVSLQAPHELGYNSYAWYSINFDANQNKFSDLAEASISADRIATFIQEFTENPMVDANKVFVLGFSQGAILSYGLALNSTKIHHVIALSGYLNKDLITGDPAKSTADFFVSHGSMDQVIPVEWARKAPTYLKQQGLDCGYKEYPVGHGVHPQNFHDFKEWMLQRL
jgi:phospholipase/carboxylesterase